MSWWWPESLDQLQWPHCDLGWWLGIRESSTNGCISYFQAIDLLEFSQIGLKFFRGTGFYWHFNEDPETEASSFLCWHLWSAVPLEMCGEICRMWYGHECLAVGHFRPWISRLYLFGSKVPMGHLLTFLLSRSLQLFIATSWMSILDSLNTHTHMVQMVHV